MATQPPQTGESGSELSETTGAVSNASLEATQQQCRHRLVHYEAANVATENMTQDAHLKTVCKTGCSTNKKQHAITGEYVHIMVHGHQLIE